MSWFCKHKYKVIKVISVYSSDFDYWLKTNRTDNDIPIYYKYVLQCEHCGKIKTKKV